MILSPFFTIQTWIAVVPCVLILSAAVIKALTIDMARDKITNTALKKEIDTSFVRALQADLKALSDRASEENIRLRLSKSAESVRYSDPVSKDTLAEIETKMSAVFDEIKSAVNAGNNDAEALIDELNDLLSARNEKCRMSKSIDT